MSESADILQAVAGWLAQEKKVALATVVQTWGSSPRPVGSQMAISHLGEMTGSVSGGCIEGAVVEAALQTIDDGTPQNLSFGVSNERAWEVGLACGGQVRVFVERVEA